MSVRANANSASAANNMIIAWKNPYNVGQNVVISNCTLEFGIVWNSGRHWSCRPIEHWREGGKDCNEDKLEHQTFAASFKD
jgi:hypothetical protein